MPTKERYARGHRGNWKKRPHPERPRGPSMLTESLPGQASRTHNSPEAPADWGGDSHGDGSAPDNTAPASRNGGMRFFRAIDVSDRDEREARGLKCLKYSWRSFTGPTPNVVRGDVLAAKAYLRKLEAAIDQGGWTTSEALGLYHARKVWAIRARGDDPRYNEVGNRKGGLTQQETANVEQRRIVIEMKQMLEAAGRSSGD